MREDQDHEGREVHWITDGSVMNERDGGLRSRGRGGCVDVGAQQDSEMVRVTDTSKNDVLALAFQAIRRGELSRLQLAP